MADRPRLRLADPVRAVIELGLARLKLNRHCPTSDSTDQGPLDRDQSALVDRVAYVIPRVAARMPWRADCLVQALAAEHWLASQGTSSQLILGVPRKKPDEFEAHAWLTAGGRIVTGGDISGYVPLQKG